MLADAKKYEEPADSEERFSLGQALSIANGYDLKKDRIGDLHVLAFSTKLDKAKIIKLYGQPDETGDERVQVKSSFTTFPMIRYGWLPILLTDDGHVCGLYKRQVDED